MENLTYKELHRQLDYTPFDGLFRWKISKGTAKKGNIAGYKDPEGYIIIGINGKLYKAHRLAWFWVYGYMPENQIDHKKRNTHDTRIRRLREVSQQCNSRNSGNPITNTSGVKGISRVKKLNKWTVQIGINGVQKYIGIHKNFDEAVCHRLAGEQCLNWEGCDSSSPAYKHVQKMLNKIKENK